MASVDVVVPCYQYGRFLREAVASVQSQGIDDLRILIIDNASTDNSVEVARQLAAEDNRVEVRARPVNLGPHASFNEGVDWATSDYCMVLCADDLLAPGMLARAVAIMESHPEVSFTLGRDLDFGPANPLPAASATAAPAPWRIETGLEFIRDRCRNPEFSIAAGMVLVRTATQKKVGHYRTELPHTDDLEMLLRLAQLGSVARTEAVQGYKRMHGANQTHNFLANRTRDLVERLAAFESYFSKEGRAMPEADRLLRLSRRSLAERAYWCAVSDLCRGRSSAIELFRMALRLNPLVVVVPPLNYVSRMERPFGRIGKILSEAVGMKPKMPAADGGQGDKAIVPARTPYAK